MITFYVTKRIFIHPERNTLHLVSFADYDYVYPNSMTSSDDVGCDSDGNDSLSCYSAGTDGIDPHDSQITDSQ